MDKLEWFQITIQMFHSKTRLNKGGGPQSGELIKISLERSYYFDMMIEGSNLMLHSVYF